MKKILVVFNCNNGYTCSCCGKWWEESDIFEIEDDADAKEFVNNLDTEAQKNKDYGRISVESAYVISEVII